MRRAGITRVALAVVAAALVGLSSVLPLWCMTMKAPQYPKGLKLYAYGTGISGDLREINILNHYLGMAPLETPPLEVALFPVGVAVLIALCLAAPLHRYLSRLAIAALVSTPAAVLADLQWRLYTFGHGFDPHAPIRLKPFTPPVIGSNTMWNFETSSMIGWGIVCLLVAAVVLAAGPRIAAFIEPASPKRAAGRDALGRAAALLLVVAAGTPAVVSAETLQHRLASAPPGGVVTVDGGVHQGPLRIHGPLTVIGTNWPVIDGNGTGSVVTIEGHDVVFRGFIVRNSGRQVTEEAAGITITGDRHRIEGNRVHDVYFGIHIGDGAGHVVDGNTIAPGTRHGARPGHGISIWHVQNTQVRRNHVSESRDGIYLSFTAGVVVADNDISRCRYGMHSMYSENATFTGNRVRGNLLGAALMMSDKLVLRGNRIEQHREGSAAYGVLLKDIGDLQAEGNIILANRVGVYAEGVPSDPSREAVVAGNVIAGNEVGLALQSNAALTLTENRIAENLTDVRALGRKLSPSMQWSRNGRGNFWSQYRGYDSDRDGIGDVSHRVEDAMDALVRRNPLTQAFLYTPAHLAIEAATRMFPLLRQEPLFTDQHPLMSAPTGAVR
jgi:nitrous oxidase accessory protein